MNALVRLMNGESDYGSMSEEDLLILGSFGRKGRETLHQVVLELRRRDWTFAQIGERMGVTESAASRWAKPPPRWGRPPNVRDEES